jgi:PmbA protein
MQDIISKLGGVSARIIGTIDKGDTIAVYSEDTAVVFENDRLKAIEESQRFAVGLRIFEDGRVGNSFVNSLDDVDVLIHNARESARFGDPVEIDLPPASDFPRPKLYYPQVIDYPKEEAVRIGEDAVRRLKEIDSRAQLNIEITKGRTYESLRNTSGFDGSFEETGFSFGVAMNLVEDGGGLLDVGYGDSAYSTNLDWDKIFETIEWRYRNAMTTVSIDSGEYSLLLAPDVSDLLIDPLLIASNGKNLYKGISVLSQKEGHKIAGDMFTLTDDPLYDGATGISPFDGDGIVAGAMPVIENGVFRNFALDLTTAWRLGRGGNGRARRGIAGLPNPGFSNLILSTGNNSLEEMIGSIKKGVYLISPLGGGQSNMTAGDISVNIGLGYYIENGKIRGRVKNAMIAGNVYDWLKTVSMMEDRLHKLGSLFAPHILIENVSIAG